MNLVYEEYLASYHWIEFRLRSALKFVAELSLESSEFIIMRVQIESRESTHPPATIRGGQHFVQILSDIRVAYWMRDLCV